ncbi:hypothetical protein [uncultured Bilophila sp.]|nr:hypothetical protein [uncultured Bilophila sp.]
MMFSFFSKLLPFLKPLTERLFTDSARRAELEAEKELAEARAFAKGRISPKYLLKYVLVAAFAVFAAVTLLHFFFPRHFAVSPLAELRELIGVAADIFGLGVGF